MLSENTTLKILFVGRKRYKTGFIGLCKGIAFSLQAALVIRRLLNDKKQLLLITRETCTIQKLGIKMGRGVIWVEKR